MRRGFTGHYNGPPVNAVAHTRCIAFWRAVRNFHMTAQYRADGTLLRKAWSDIAYSFGVCPHGERFEGRGWTQSQWANGEDQVGENNGPDSQWYTVLAFIGEGEVPSGPMLNALTALIAEGRDTGRCGLAVKPHNDFRIKACPGPELTLWCRAWDAVPFPPLTPDEPEPDMPLTQTEINAVADAVWSKVVFTLGPDGWNVPEPAYNVLRYGAESAHRAAVKTVDVSGLAFALAALLPAGAEVTQEQIESAVKSALRSGTDD